MTLIKLKDVYNSFSEVLELIKVCTYSTQLRLNCNFNLYSIYYKFNKSEVDCKKLTVNSISITTIHEEIHLVIFFNDGGHKKSKGIILNGYNLAKFEKFGLIMEDCCGYESVKYFTAKYYFMLELSTNRKSYIQNLLIDIIETDNMYSELYNKISQWK